MKVSHIPSIERELTSSCVVRYGLVIVYGGTNWITSVRILVGMEW